MKTPSMQSIAGLALAAALSAPLVIAPAYAALPVIDGANLSRNIVTALESVAQTLKQIQQYKTQLQQYQNMLQNTAAPNSYTWDQATATMNQLRRNIDTLAYYKSSLGSIDAYLAKFKDTKGYRASPCFSANGCSEAEWKAMNDARRLGLEAQKKAADGLFRGLDQQQDALQSDARQLQRLQAGAQGTTGQMQALGFANQLASQQANQLLQIRGLLISQQNLIAARNQTLADREAMQQASDEQVLKNTYRPSPVRNW